MLYMIHIHTHTHIYIYIYIYKSTNGIIPCYIIVFACTDMHLYYIINCIYIYIYIYIYVYIYVYIYTYIYIYMYKHPMQMIVRIDLYVKNSSDNYMLVPVASRLRRGDPLLPPTSICEVVLLRIYAQHLCPRVPCKVLQSICVTIVSMLQNNILQTNLDDNSQRMLHNT